MSIALYRKYRSATFGELIGQEQIATTLLSEIRTDKMVHGYLFAGIRGTGKTSTARILARAVNCLDRREGEPCNACTACIEISGGGSVDVLEIDAASNRGIEEMRDLREKVKYLPASLRRKVYIIDEAHMLTPEAWNAFLKTLEEPPEHVLFLLATTEAHKVPETVRSRVQRFDFRRVDREDIARHLGSIAVREDIVVEPEALDLLARAGRGSVRDALSLLDQALASPERPVGLASVRRALGLADPGVVHEMLRAVAGGDAAAALRACATAFEGGADSRQLIREAARLGRGAELCAIGYSEGADLGPDEMALCDGLARAGAPGLWLTALDLFSQTETALRQPVDPRLQVELCLLRLAQSARAPAHDAARVGARLDALEARLNAGPGAPPAASPAVTTAPAAPAGGRGTVAAGVPQSGASVAPPAAAGAKERRAPEARGADRPSAADPALNPHGPASGEAGDPGAPPRVAEPGWDGLWPSLIDAVSRRDRMLAGLLRSCKPIAGDEPGTLQIAAAFAFHYQNVRDPAKLALISAAAGEVAGSVIVVSAVFAGDDDGPAASRPGGGGADEDGPDPTRAALAAFPGSRITGTRMNDGADPVPRSH